MCLMWRCISSLPAPIYGNAVAAVGSCLRIEEPAMVVVSLCSVVEDNFYWRFIASLFEKTPLLPWPLGDPIFPS